MPLTLRQKKILAKIIQEFMKTGLPVGSVLLSDKYDLGVSPATLRAEMARLAKEGYIYKVHTSSGRVPTTAGLRYFLNEISEEEEIGRILGAELKENLFQTRFNRTKFIREIVEVLSELTRQPALSLVDDVVFSSGVSRLLNQPEFEDLYLLQNALNVLDSKSLLDSIFHKYARDMELTTLIGEEIGIDSLTECSIVFSPFKYFRGNCGYLGVIGPRRMKYSRIIPAVREMSSFIEDSIRGWQ